VDCTHLRLIRLVAQANLFQGVETEAEGQTFHCFSHLPLEIRHEIWTLAFPFDARIITLVEAVSSNYQRPLNIPDSTGSLHPDSKVKATFQPLPVLSLCQDSRAFALTFYNLSFHRQLIHPVYFNHRKDILFTVDAEILKRFLSLDIGSAPQISPVEDIIRSLALDPFWSFRRDRSPMWNVTTLRETVAIMKQTLACIPTIRKILFFYEHKYEYNNVEGCEDLANPLRTLARHMQGLEHFDQTTSVVRSLDFSQIRHTSTGPIDVAVMEKELLNSDLPSFWSVHEDSEGEEGDREKYYSGPIDLESKASLNLADDRP